MCFSKILYAVALAVITLLPAHSGAVSISITGGSWSLGSGWGPACTSVDCDAAHAVLNVDWTINGGLAQTFKLENLDDTFLVTFGTGVFSDENNTLESTETDGLGIAAVLGLGSPVAGNYGHAAILLVTGGTLGDAQDDFSLTFAPVTVGFGDGGQFTVDFSEPAWTCNPSQACTFGSAQTRTVSVLFTLTALPTAETPAAPSNLPLPAPIGLLAAGLFALGLMRRKRMHV